MPSEVCSPPVTSQLPLPSAGNQSQRPHSPLPYDSKEKMIRPTGPTSSPEYIRLPFEVRDSSLPKGVPTVKMRKKPKALDVKGDPVSARLMLNPSSSYEDFAVALSPVVPKFPSLPSSHEGDVQNSYTRQMTWNWPPGIDCRGLTYKLNTDS